MGQGRGEAKVSVADECRGRGLWLGATAEGQSWTVAVGGGGPLPRVTTGSCGQEPLPMVMPKVCGQGPRPRAVVNDHCRHGIPGCWVAIGGHVDGSHPASTTSGAEGASTVCRGAGGARAASGDAGGGKSRCREHRGGGTATRDNCLDFSYLLQQTNKHPSFHYHILVSI